MKLSNKWTIMEMAGEYVAVSCETQEDGFRGIVRLNETGKTIWDGISADRTEEEIAEQMVKEYDGLAFEQALKDTQNVIRILQSEGLLEE